MFRAPSITSGADLLDDHDQRQVITGVSWILPALKGSKEKSFIVKKEGSIIPFLNKLLWTVKGVFAEVIFHHGTEDDERVLIDVALVFLEIKMNSVLQCDLLEVFGATRVASCCMTIRTVAPLKHTHEAAVGIHFLARGCFREIVRVIVEELVAHSIVHELFLIESRDAGLDHRGNHRVVDVEDCLVLQQESRSLIAIATDEVRLVPEARVHHGCQALHDHCWVSLHCTVLNCECTSNEGLESGAIEFWPFPAVLSVGLVSALWHERLLSFCVILRLSISFLSEEAPKDSK